MSDTAMTPLEEAQHQIIAQDDALRRLGAEPFLFGMVVKISNSPPTRELFDMGDMVIVTDRNHPMFDKHGRIFEPPDDEGYIHVKITGGSFYSFAVGLEGKDRSQVKIVGKDDGRFVIIQTPESLIQVEFPHVEIAEGDCVRINASTKQIINVAAFQPGNDIGVVKEILPDGRVLVDLEGKTRLVFPGKTRQQKLNAGDSVLLDESCHIILDLISQCNESLWHIDQDVNIHWDQIGGCREAKKLLLQAIEYPYRYPDLYSHYRKKTPKGIMLYGPPGCGKTLLAKGVASSVARLHGQDKVRTGFRLVKGPELLDKFWGVTEANIRALFAQGEKHFSQFGFPCVIAIDEAEAILPRRGTSHDNHMDRAVNMFLSEMSGANTMNSIVLLLTNRPDLMDSAASRDGRIDLAIKVPRPNDDVVGDILQIYLQNIPLQGTDIDTVIARATAEIFSPSRILFRMSAPGRENLPAFSLSDCVNGAMIEGLVQKAIAIAIDRDIHNKSVTGVQVNDFCSAIDWTFNQNRNLNQDLNLLDYADRLEIPFKDLQVEKSFS